MKTTFTKRLVTRAAQAMQEAGLVVSGVEIRRDGTIIVTTQADADPNQLQTGSSHRSNGAEHARTKLNAGPDRNQAKERVRALLERAQPRA